MILQLTVFVQLFENPFRILVSLIKLISISLFEFLLKFKFKYFPQNSNVPQRKILKERQERRKAYTQKVEQGGVKEDQNSPIQEERTS
jgi:hypothetical protein